MPNPRPRDPPYTGWHFFFVKLLETTTDPNHLEVKAFDKLGDLPLEADAVLLRKLDDALLLFHTPDLAFLGPYLRRYTVLEFKSPQDRLTWEDFDTGRAYAMLAKRKYGLKSDGDVGLVFLASAVARNFYAVCAANGYPFTPDRPGVMSCRTLPLHFHVLDLKKLGQAYPQSLVNLLSPRRQVYRLSAQQSRDPRWLLALDLICATLSQEFRNMLDKHKDIPGLSELTQDLAALRRQVMALHTVDERLEGLSPEDRLKGLPPEDRLKGLPPEDRLKGLSQDERAELLRLLSKEQG